MSASELEGSPDFQPAKNADLYTFLPEAAAALAQNLEPIIERMPAEVIGYENATRLLALSEQLCLDLETESQKKLAQALEQASTPVMPQLRQADDYNTGSTYMLQLPTQHSFGPIVLIEVNSDYSYLHFEYPDESILVQVPLSYPLLLSQVEYDQLSGGKRGPGIMRLCKLYQVGVILMARSDENRELVYQNAMRHFGFAVERRQLTYLGPVKN